MKWFDDLKTRIKLIGCFVLVLMFMAAIVLLGVTQILSIQKNYDITINSPMAARRNVIAFQRDYRDVRRCAMVLAAFTGTGNDDKCENAYKDGITAYNAAVQDLQDCENAFMANPNITQEAKKQRMDYVDAMREHMDNYKTQVLDIAINLSRAGNRDDILNAITQVGDDNAAKVKENSEKLLDVISTATDSSIANSHAAVTRIITIILIVSAAAIVISIIIIRVLDVSITKPLTPLTGFMHKANATGDIVINKADEEIIAGCSTRKDELGELIRSTAGFITTLITFSKDLKDIADGDLTVKVPTISEKDVLGTSLRRMAENMKNVFEQIAQASDQVNSGGSQVSGAAQALSQGATEQASAVQELSASINEVSRQINDNSANASKANELVNETEIEVSRGNTHMAEMLNAMSEINSASNEISKIIKVIDDIAFQTNILALNAAVEAARAGAAGKGFAVVAEEVRNLASKSADAAKQTTALIEGSIASVEKGSGTAQDTAKSLGTVAEKTKQVQKLVNEIAEASKEQADAVRQITTGVEQISQVVQTNSATAEQSAAASQELSGQALMLQEQVSKMKLK